MNVSGWNGIIAWVRDVNVQAKRLSPISWVTRPIEKEHMQCRESCIVSVRCWSCRLVVLGRCTRSSSSTPSQQWAVPCVCTGGSDVLMWRVAKDTVVMSCLTTYGSHSIVIDWRDFGLACGAGGWVGVLSCNPCKLWPYVAGGGGGWAGVPPRLAPPISLLHRPAWSYRGSGPGIGFIMTHMCVLCWVFMRGFCVMGSYLTAECKDWKCYFFIDKQWKDYSALGFVRMPWCCGLILFWCV